MNIREVKTVRCSPGFRDRAGGLWADCRTSSPATTVAFKFLEGVGPRPYNSKVDNSLLGVTNISGLLKNHDTPADQLDVQALKKKLGRTQAKLKRKWNAYQKMFVKDRNRNVRVLPRPGTTRDGIGQLRTAQFSQSQRKRLLEQMNADAG